MVQKQKESIGEFRIKMDHLAHRLDNQEIDTSSSKTTIGYLQKQCDAVIEVMSEFRIRTTEEMNAEHQKYNKIMLENDEAVKKAIKVSKLLEMQ